MEIRTNFCHLDLHRSMWLPSLQTQIIRAVVLEGSLGAVYKLMNYSSWRTHRAFHRARRTRSCPRLPELCKDLTPENFPGLAAMAKALCDGLDIYAYSILPRLTMPKLSIC